MKKTTWDLAGITYEEFKTCAPKKRVEMAKEVGTWAAFLEMIRIKPGDPDSLIEAWFKHSAEWYTIQYKYGNRVK